MKLILTKILLIFTISIFVFSCDKEAKPITNDEYSVNAKTINLQWTAYKTTKKVPVKGTFKTVNLIKEYTGKTPMESLNNLEFSIPVNSIDSNKPERDVKLVTSFFGSMKDTKSIHGVIKLDENGIGSVRLTMNGIIEKLPVTYAINDSKATVKATLQLDNWKGEAAINALNEACGELHKGEDGISKTWNEVTLQIEVNFLKK